LPAFLPQSLEAELTELIRDKRGYCCVLGKRLVHNLWQALSDESLYLPTRSSPFYVIDKVTNRGYSKAAADKET
jgi:hypothetical protein